MVDQQKYLIGLLHNFEDLFNGALGMWKNEPVEFKRKENETGEFETISCTKDTHSFKKEVKRLVLLKSLKN